MKKNLEDTIRLTEYEMGQDEIIKNKELRKLIEFKIGKKKMESSDLTQIEEICLEGKNIVGEENTIYFEEILLFPNVKKISINNTNVKNSDMQFLKGMEEISFRNCKIENMVALEKVKRLALKRVECTNIGEIAKLTSLVELEISGIEVKSFDFLKNLKNLKILKLKNNPNVSMKDIDFFLPIEVLAIGGVDKMEIAVVEKYANLKTISIDLEKEEEWKEELQKLQSKKITIFFNDIYGY